MPTTVKFRKHGRKGKPKSKKITIDNGKIEWGKNSISVKDIVNLCIGKGTEVFERSGKGIAAGQCLSIVCKDRTLDLENPRDDHKDVKKLLKALETELENLDEPKVFGFDSKEIVKKLSALDDDGSLIISVLTEKEKKRRSTQLEVPKKKSKKKKKNKKDDNDDHTENDNDDDENKKSKKKHKKKDKKKQKKHKKDEKDEKDKKDEKSEADDKESKKQPKTDNAQPKEDNTDKKEFSFRRYKEKGSREKTFSLDIDRIKWDSGKIKYNDITDISLGKETKILQNNKRSSKLPNAGFLTIKSHKQTLDLEELHPNERVQLVKKMVELMKELPHPKRPSQDFSNILKTDTNKVVNIKIIYADDSAEQNGESTVEPIQNKNAPKLAERGKIKKRESDVQRGSQFQVVVSPPMAIQALKDENDDHSSSVPVAAKKDDHKSPKSAVPSPSQPPSVTAVPPLKPAPVVPPSPPAPAAPVAPPSVPVPPPAPAKKPIKPPITPPPPAVIPSSRRSSTQRTIQTDAVKVVQYGIQTEPIQTKSMGIQTEPVRFADDDQQPQPPPPPPQTQPQPQPQPKQQQPQQSPQITEIKQPVDAEAQDDISIEETLSVNTNAKTADFSSHAMDEQKIYLHRVKSKIPKHNWKKCRTVITKIATENVPGDLLTANEWQDIVHALWDLFEHNNKLLKGFRILLLPQEQKMFTMAMNRERKENIAKKSQSPQDKHQSQVVSDKKKTGADDNKTTHAHLSGKVFLHGSSQKFELYMELFENCLYVDSAPFPVDCIQALERGISNTFISENLSNDTCFTLVTTRGSLQLECLSKEICDVWCENIAEICRDKKDNENIQNVTNNIEPVRVESPVESFKQPLRESQVQSQTPKESVVPVKIELGSFNDKFMRHSTHPKFTDANFDAFTEDSAVIFPDIESLHFTFTDQFDNNGFNFDRKYNRKSREPFADLKYDSNTMDNLTAEVYMNRGHPSVMISPKTDSLKFNFGESQSPKRKSRSTCRKNKVNVQTIFNGDVREWKLNYYSSYKELNEKIKQQYSLNNKNFKIKHIDGMDQTVVDSQDHLYQLHHLYGNSLVLLVSKSNSIRKKKSKNKRKLSFEAEMDQFEDRISQLLAASQL